MTLTGVGGSLGIGVTQPEQTLHVGGGATVDGTLLVSNNLTVNNTISATTLLGNYIGVAVTATDFIGNLSGNVNTTTGISTFFRLETSSNGKIGIAATAPLGSSSDVVRINTYPGSGPLNRVMINDKGQVGIKTNVIINNDQVGVDCRYYAGLFKNLIVGRNPTGINPSIDFRDAGSIGIATNRSMVLPTVTTTIRNSLPAVRGSVIYNSISNRMELYNGTGWVGIATVT